MAKKKVKLRKRLDIRLLIIPVLAIAAAGVYSYHFAAASFLPYQICNSSASDDRLEVSSTTWTDVTPLIRIGKDQCKSFNFPASSVRVGVDAYGSPDIDSYKLGIIGQGYGPCHHGENDFSDPPNTGQVRYRNYTNGSCS